MRILVFSDTHTSIYGMFRTVHGEKPDAVFHLGDHDRDARRLAAQFPGLPLYMVAGNTDDPYDTPEELTPELCGYRLLLTHGNLYGVRANNQTALVKRARELQCSVVLFGHTHEPYARRLGEVWLFNPGHAGKEPIVTGKPTCGVLTLESTGLRWEIREL
ncbi:MAG: metallophosphoesterase [Clostridiales bacterium]|nr:metallophosphoesterase [Clostridiales bacterium]